MVINSTSRKNLARHQGRATALASRLHLNSSVRELVVTQALSEQTIKSQPLIGHAVAKALNEMAAWISDRNLSFLITSIGLIVMLLWAGSYKMTAPGAEGIVPLVSNSPLISWHFKLFGTYIGSDLIGLTELIAAY